PSLGQQTETAVADAGVRWAGVNRQGFPAHIALAVKVPIIFLGIVIRAPRIRLLIEAILPKEGQQMELNRPKRIPVRLEQARTFGLLAGGELRGSVLAPPTVRPFPPFIHIDRRLRETPDRGRQPAEEILAGV